MKTRLRDLGTMTIVLGIMLSFIGELLKFVAMVLVPIGILVTISWFSLSKLNENKKKKEQTDAP